jgi:hypothetical protein
MKGSALPILILATLTPACAANGASGGSDTKQLVPPPNVPLPSVVHIDPITLPTHFAGLPPEGTQPSRPSYDGRIILNVSPALPGGSWNINADGRILITGDAHALPQGANPLHAADVQQWLTPQGVQLLRSRILEIGRPVGLFGPKDHGYTRRAYVKRNLVDWYQVRIGRRLKDVQVVPTGGSNDPAATPAEVSAMDRINSLVAHSTTRLPASAWRDSTIRPYIPSHYCVVWDRAAPNPAKLPFPASELLAQLLPSWSGTASGTLTTDQARALFVAFARAGLKLLNNHPGEIDWRVPTAVEDPPYTILDFGPGLPNDGC